MENNILTEGEWAPVFTDGKCVGVGVVSGNAFSQIICASILPDNDADYAAVQNEIEGDMRLLAASKEMYAIIKKLIEAYNAGGHPFARMEVFDRSITLVKKVGI